MVHEELGCLIHYFPLTEAPFEALEVCGCAYYLDYFKLVQAKFA